MRCCGAILSEDGAHLYRFVFLAAQELLWTARKWRNDIETQGPGKLDFAQATRELDGTVKSLDIRLAPPVVDGRPIDPRDKPDWFKMPGVVQVDIAEQLRVSRAGVFSAMGFSEKSAHEVVQQLGKDTLEAVQWLAPQKGLALDYLLNPVSPLRTERQGLGPISVAEANRLEAECLWEAENAWERAKAPPSARDETADNHGNQPPRAYLTSWQDILITLGKKDNREDQRQLKALNKKYAGPIITPKQGAQPKVDKAKLLEWWDGLEQQFQESQQRQRDTKATVAAQHPYARGGTVVPDIGGGVKKRRDSTR